MVSCDKALRLYNKLKNEIYKDKEVYPTGGLLLCLDEETGVTEDVDIIVKNIRTFIHTKIDDIVVHVYPWIPELYTECYKLKHPSATYYCIKYKLALLRTQSVNQP